MNPRKLIEERDKLVSDIIPELLHIQDKIPQLIEKLKEWPIIAKGPIKEEVYRDLRDTVEDLLLQHVRAVTQAWEKSYNNNNKIQEIIRKAYE